MRKVNDLRAYLLHRIPMLANSPERLLTFIENGQLEHWKGQQLSHRLTMPVRIIITDWKGDSDDIIIPILEWLNVREPGYDPQNTIRFESEIIDSETMDIMLSVNITERVIVTEKEEGGYNIEHVLPPAPWRMNKDAELEIIVEDTKTNEQEQYPEP